MSNKISIDELNEYADDETYHVDQISIRAMNMDKANLYIERCKALHRECGCFIKYTCVCNPNTGFTKWYMIYRTAEYMAMNLGPHTDDIWKEIFPDAPISHDPVYTEITDGGIYEPCVCPFSGG